MYTKLTNEQLKNKNKFVDNYIHSKNPADGSIVDKNANITIKSIGAMEHEMFKDFHVQISRNRAYNKIKEMFGEHVSDSYLNNIKNHLCYVHDETSNRAYCCSVTMYPFLLNGTKGIGGESLAPKHLHSFVGSFVNLMYILASHVSGAVAVPEVLICFDKFASQDYGDDYLTTHKTQIENYFQEMIYCLNQPAAARGGQSVFSNFAIFDKYFMEGLFGQFSFPDGSKPKFERIYKLQYMFLDWFKKEREKEVLTFPVVTIAMLSDGKQIKDEAFALQIAKELSEGNSFFIYISPSVDSLSSCCFDGNQMTLSKSSDGVNWMSFKDLYNSKYQDTKRNFTIFQNGSWCKGKVVKINKSNKKMFKIITSNNKEIVVSEDHINPTFDGEKETKNLTINDYLLFNTKALDTFPEQDLNLTMSQGILIGAYLGDGSPGRNAKTGIEYVIHLSLNEEKYKRLIPHIKNAIKSWGFSEDIIKLHPEYNKVYPVTINSKKLVEIIRYWIKGNYGYEKEINLNCLLQSTNFRQGIIHGYYATDGGNSNRIFSTSEKLIYQIEAILVSLGYNSIINVSDRTNEKVVIRGEEFNRNYKLYCIRFYSFKNKRSMKDVFLFKNNSMYFKIKSIEEISHSEDDIYCFEMKDPLEPYFTLPNGIITHNCRLRNEIQDNTFSYTLGAVGVMTGSVRVITMNVNRYVQNIYRNYQYETEKTSNKKYTMNFMNFLKLNLKNFIHTIQKYHLAHRILLEEFQANTMMPTYDAGFIHLNKQYSTIGINGIVEAAEFLGLEISNNSEYKEFVSEFLKVIYDANKEAKKEFGCMFNTEFVPAENLGVKNAKWDKEDGYEVKRDCYNSYLYKVEDNNINPIDKFILHGEATTRYLDGGSALHLNLDEDLTQEQYLKLFEVAIKSGCSYWCKNVKSTYCNDCNYIDKRTLSKCSKCNSDKISYLTRIIGYLKKIENFSSERQIEAALRFYHKERK